MALHNPSDPLKQGGPITATYDIYVAGAAKDPGGPGSQGSRGPPPMGGRRPGGWPIGDSPPEYGRLKVCAPLRLTNGHE